MGLSPAWLAFGDRRATGEPDPERLAERARSARELRALTFHAVGLLAGSSYGQAQALEADADPSISIVERFAEALAVSASWLAFGLGDRDLPRRGAKPAASPVDAEPAGAP
jgi:transcriptional regulator with XRE-family HTH domain